MASLYSKSMSTFIHTRAWPVGFEWRIIEEEEYLQFVMFRDNFESYDGEDKYQIAMMVKEVMEKIRGTGIPIYLEVKAGNGRES